MKPRPGGLFADRFRLERKVGGGRVSDVWRAIDEETQSSVALKFQQAGLAQHPEADARFLREQRIASSLQGPYFARLVSYGMWEDRRYLAWQWHQGESFRDLLERNPLQDAQTLDTVMREACAALSQVHRAGYVHGNLKPESLFFEEQAETARRQLRLFGFKVASSTAASDEADRFVGPGRLVGTPLYMSLGQVRGRAPLAPRDDLWALGVIAYEALTGRMPFWGNDAEGVFESIKARKCEPPGARGRLGDGFDQFWQRVVREDFSRAEDFCEALTGALGPALRHSLTQRSAFTPLLAERAPQQAPTEASVSRAGSPSVVAGQEEPTAQARERPGSRLPSTPGSAAAGSATESSAAAGSAAAGSAAEGSAAAGSFAAVEAAPQRLKEWRSQTLIGLSPIKTGVGDAVAEVAESSGGCALGAAGAAPSAQPPARGNPSGSPPPQEAQEAEVPLLLTNLRGARNTIRFPVPPVPPSGAGLPGRRDTIRQQVPAELRTGAATAHKPLSRRGQLLAAAVVCGLALLAVLLRAGRDKVPRVNTLGQQARALGAAPARGASPERRGPEDGAESRAAVNLRRAPAVPAYDLRGDSSGNASGSHETGPDADNPAREGDLGVDGVPSTPRSAPGKTAG